MQKFQIVHSKGIRALALACVAAAMGGCGGVADGIANDISNGISCGLTNCKESNTLSLDDIRVAYTATQEGGTVTVDAVLSYRANVFTAVQLSPNSDSIVLSTRNQGFADTSQGRRSSWRTSYADASVSPTVGVRFTRQGQNYDSSLVMPPPMSFLSQPPLQLQRSAGQMQVALNLPQTNTLPVYLSGNCARTDGSTFALAGDPSVSVARVGPVSGGASYTLSTLDLDRQLNSLSQQANNNASTTPLVQSCDLTVFYSLEVVGKAHPALSTYSGTIARSQLRQTLRYLGTQ